MAGLFFLLRALLRKTETSCVLYNADARWGKGMRKQKIGVAKLVLSAACGSFLALASAAQAKDAAAVSFGENVFKQTCASCHPAGGNIVKARKPVAGSSKLSSLAVFKAYLTAPLGHMPYYKFVVSDPKTLKALYDYCRSLKPPQQALAKPLNLARR